MSGEMSYAAQWWKTPLGASGSSTTSAKLRVSAGAPCHSTRGEMFPPWRVNWSGMRCFGANADQSELAPDSIVASAVVDVAGAYVEMAKIVRDGHFKPEVQHFGMNQGTISVVWNPKLKEQIAPATVAEADRIVAAIKKGEVKPPAGF
jgi:hypothetical protein